MTRLLCLGDSITDCGRLFAYPPLGNGYVQKLHDKLKASGDFWTIKNCGVDGFTVSRLLENAAHRYSPFHADIVTILIGINDIGLMMNTNRSTEQKEAMLQKFLKDYEKLLRELTSPGCRILLMEPFLFPYPEEYLAWFPHLHSMSEGIGNLAEKYNLPYLSLHERLNCEAQKQGVHFITTDGIHLTDRGHEIISDILFQKLNGHSY